MDSLNLDVNSLLLTIAQDCYQRFTDEIRITHEVPEWYGNYIEYISTIDVSKVFKYISLMDYFNVLPSRGGYTKDLYDEHGAYNVISNTKFNNGVAFKSNKYEYECTSDEPLYTLGFKGKGTSGCLFKQTSTFITLGAPGSVKVLKPVRDIIFDPDIDPINYKLVNIQTRSFFVNCHNGNNNWLKNLKIYIINDDTEEGLQFRHLYSINHDC